MSKLSAKKLSTEKLVIGAALTALVIVLQLVGSFIRFGVFSVTLVLVPIVIGAALCGTKIAAWLGFVFGVTVLLSGDAAAFMAINIWGTVITVLLKGIACGLAAGITYKLLEKKNFILAVMSAAVICPIVNTGIFLLGCVVFFLKDVAAWGAAEGYQNVAAYMFLILAGGNFIFEVIVNLVLGPVVTTIIKTVKKAK